MVSNMTEITPFEEIRGNVLANKNGNPYYELVLSLTDAAQKAMEVAESVGEVKDIRDKLKGIEVYIKQRGAEHIAANLAVAQRLRTERVLGEMLAGMEKNRGGWMFHEKNRGHAGTPTLPLLSDYGISKKQSSRWQLLSKIPEDHFETWVQENLEIKEFTRTGFLRSWQAIVDPQPMNRAAYSFVAPETAILGKVAEGYTDDLRSSDIVNFLSALCWWFRYAETHFDMMGCGQTRTCLLRRATGVERIASDDYPKELSEKINQMSDIEIDEFMCNVCKRVTFSLSEILDQESEKVLRGE